MNSTGRTTVAAAMAGGYLLGRTRKAKAAFALGTLVAGRTFGLTPAGLAAEGMRRLNRNPHVQDLREQIRGGLMTAVRTAASAWLDRGSASLAESLRARRRDQNNPPQEAEGVEQFDGGEENGADGDVSARRSAPAKRAAGAGPSTPRTGPNRRGR